MQLLVDRRKRVLIATISNPSARNALWPSLYADLTALISSADADLSIGAVVLNGDGEHFCGGGNLKRLDTQRGLPADDQSSTLESFNRLILDLQACRKPVLAAVEGVAAGGGFSLALACDLIVAADNAKFVMSYAKVALSPDGGASDSLANMLPPQAALEILWDGGFISPARLKEFGIVNRVVAAGAAADEAIAWAERLALGPSRAQAAIKQLVYGARNRTREQQLSLEKDAFLRSLYGEEAGEGIRAFLEKRTARFHGDVDG
jgi:enoyl-CoA hydratase/carnithine racemase